MVTTGAPPIHGNQIPSYLDVNTAFNASSGGGFDLLSPGGCFEFLSGAGGWQLVKWAPTDALMNVSYTSVVDGAPQPVWFTFAKPFADGTAQDVSLGGQAIDRASGHAMPLSAGAVGSNALRVSLCDLMAHAPSLLQCISALTACMTLDFAAADALHCLGLMWQVLRCCGC